MKLTVQYYSRLKDLTSTDEEQFEVEPGVSVQGLLRRLYLRHAGLGAWNSHLLVAVDTSLRMQFDADSNFYDPYDYSTGNVYDTTLGISAAATRYRRMYTALQFTSTGAPKFEATTISTVGNNSATAYASFYAKTRLGVARAALVQAVGESVKSARFGFVAIRLRTCSLSGGRPIALRSAPDEKCPPAPVRMAQRISGVSST